VQKGKAKDKGKKKAGNDQPTMMEDRQLLESRVMPVTTTKLARMAVLGPNGPLTATRLLTSIGNNRSITPFVTRGTSEATCFYE